MTTPESDLLNIPGDMALVMADAERAMHSILDGKRRPTEKKRLHCPGPCWLLAAGNRNFCAGLPLAVLKLFWTLWRRRPGVTGLQILTRTIQTFRLSCELSNGRLTRPKTASSNTGCCRVGCPAGKT